MRKKTLFKKVQDYMEKVFSYSPNQKSVECEQMDDGSIFVRIEYVNKPFSTIEIRNEKELARLKREDKRDLERGYLL